VVLTAGSKLLSMVDEPDTTVISYSKSWRLFSSEFSRKMEEM